MTYHLKSPDIIALGFMTFSLFVGAGKHYLPAYGRLTGWLAPLYGGAWLPANLR